jgi:hypothetical protein
MSSFSAALKRPYTKYEISSFTIMLRGTNDFYYSALKVEEANSSETLVLSAKIHGITECRGQVCNTHTLRGS